MGKNNDDEIKYYYNVVRRRCCTDKLPRRNESMLEHTFVI